MKYKLIAVSSILVFAFSGLAIVNLYKKQITPVEPVLTSSNEQTTTTNINISTTTKKRKKAVKMQNKDIYKSYAKELVLKNGWSEEDYNNLVKLWNKESNWNMYATNKSCYGIPQACPGSKMGGDYKTNYKTQISWGIKYIKQRYGTPTEAWKHSQKKGWY